MAKTNPAQFVRQVRQEINRITWASRRETMFASLSVFVMALIASIFFLLVDLMLSSVVQFFLSFGGYITLFIFISTLFLTLDGNKV